MGRIDAVESLGLSQFTDEVELQNTLQVSLTVEQTYFEVADFSDVPSFSRLHRIFEKFAMLG